MSDYAIKLGKHLKLVIPVLLAAALIFLAFCGHGGTSQVYNVEHNGKIFTVDQANQTIGQRGIFTALKCPAMAAMWSSKSHILTGRPIGGAKEETPDTEAGAMTTTPAGMCRETSFGMY